MEAWELLLHVADNKERGIIHLTKENAIASCKARHGIDPNKEDE